MLLKLGVPEDKITETLDYYDAPEHLHDLTKYIDTDKVAKTLVLLKESLWKRDIQQIGVLLKNSMKELDLESFTPFQYFSKNKNRMNYQSFMDKKLLCESGIVESGIRRMINLRFKAYSDEVHCIIL